MTAPLTPADCDLRDFPRMMIDIARLRGSSFDATLDDAAWRAGFNLWMTAWHQVPAASLPNDDGELAKAAGLGRDIRTWRKVKPVALMGWSECDNGLIYHAVVAEIALEAWLEKLGQRLSSGYGNAKRYGHDFDPAPLQGDIKAAAAMLRSLNSRSRMLSRPHVQKAVNGVPPGPPDLPPGAADLPPGGSEVPPRSQEKGREGNRRKGLAPHRANHLSPSRREIDDEPAHGLSSPRWSGPADFREAVVDLRGEDFAASWLDQTAWQDVPERAIVCRLGVTARRLTGDLRKLLAAHGITVRTEKAA